MLGVRSSAPASSADRRMQRAAVNITLKEQGEAWPQNKLSKKRHYALKAVIQAFCPVHFWRSLFVDVT